MSKNSEFQHLWARSKQTWALNNNNTTAKIRIIELFRRSSDDLNPTSKQGGQPAQSWRSYLCRCSRIIPMGPLLHAAECHHTVCCSIQTDLQAAFNWCVYGGSECAININFPSLLFNLRYILCDLIENVFEPTLKLEYIGCVTLLINAHLVSDTPLSTSYQWLPREEGQC